MRGLCLRIPKTLPPSQSRLFISLRSISNLAIRPCSSSFHSGRCLSSRKPPKYFSSNATPQHAHTEAKSEEHSQGPKKKTIRSSAAKNSLRRVAVEAQRSRDGKDHRKVPTAPYQATSKVWSPVVIFRQSTDHLSGHADCYGDLRCRTI